MNWRWPALIIWLMLTVAWEFGVYLTSYIPAEWTTTEMLEAGVRYGAPLYVLIFGAALDWVARGFRKPS